jgi:hypothetical protein
MALARVVAFEDVSSERVAALSQRVRDEGRPEEIPATEIVVLHDEGSAKALVVLFFDSEDDYARGDAVLSAMPDEETPGRRASVTKYEVAVRMTA